MKIGRNAPCPCGSGKKYKKCCLKETASSPDALHYRRLSKAFENLMPELIDYGVATIGKKILGEAMDEFFGWPEPHEKSDDDAVDRAEGLFWPWFIFNWEYEPVEDEENGPDIPEDTTIAELFLMERQPDPESLEGKLLTAANRSLLSFHEVLAVQPGESVQIKDVLTGTEMHVQERLGSRKLETGDILFASAVRVDNVSMFLTMAPVVFPPGMKPDLIELRRAMSRRGRGRATHEDLYEWDLEIRQEFFDMDRELHTLPKMLNTDGDPMEFHKLIYDIDSADLAVEKLASLCVTETPEEIREDAQKDQNGKITYAVFDWNRLDNPVHKGMPNTVLGKIEIRNDRMTIGVNSARRADAMKEEIESRLGAAARLRLDEITDLESMIKKQAADSPSLEPPIEADPEIQAHIGKMLQAHWEGWVDMKLPVLKNQTPRQAVKTPDGREAVEALLLDSEKTAKRDPNRWAVEKEIIADVRRKLKLDRPFREKMNVPDSKTLAEQVAKIKERITEFGDARLHDTYTGLALKLCDAIAGSDRLNIHRGRIDIWAAAIVYAVARLNFLFSNETPNHLTAEELCNWFQVKPSTTGNKASEILNALNLYQGDERFCAPHVTGIFRFYEDPRGFIHPASSIEPEDGQADAPLPLKPSPETQKAKSKPPEKTEKPAEKTDDRQLSLFDD